MPRLGRRWFGALSVAAAALALTFLTLPVVAVFVDTSPARLLESLGEPGALDALWLSLRTTAIALAIIVAIGTPAAWLLASREFRGRSLAITLVELPLVLPPAVAGIALLAALGPQGILGEPLEALGIRLPFTTAAVVTALTFVASPFYVRQAQAAFAGVTQTAPLAIYDRFSTDFEGALALSVVLIALSAAILLVVKLSARA